ncbi:MAG: DUF3617 domain-containing protein [Sphingomonadaceae bacterium]
MTLTIRRFAFASLAAMAVAACGGGDTVEAENESVESVNKKIAAADLKPNPGRWESTMTFDKIEMPGMPAEMQEMMKSQMGKATTTSSCLTQEQVDANDGEMFKPGDTPGCTYNKFSMGNGTIEADMTCSEGGTAQNMKMAGSYSEDAYDMTINADGKVEGQPMSMQMSIKSKRVGDCTGNEES